MRDSPLALRLPDFGEPGGTPPADAAPAEKPAGGFVPFAARGRTAPAFEQAGAAPAPQKLEPDEGADKASARPDHGAAALQSMLSEAFSSVAPPPVAPESMAETAAPDDGAAGEPVPDLAAELAGRDARIAELEAEIETLRTAHAAEVATLAGKALPEMAAQASRSVKTALGPLLAAPLMRAIEADAVDRFIEELEATVAAGEGVGVRLAGPPALVDRVLAGWPDGRPAPQVDRAEQTELVAIVDGAVLATRLEDLAAILTGERP